MDYLERIGVSAMCFESAPSIEKESNKSVNCRFTCTITQMAVWSREYTSKTTAAASIALSVYLYINCALPLVGFYALKGEQFLSSKLMTRLSISMVNSETKQTRETRAYGVA